MGRAGRDPGSPPGGRNLPGRGGIRRHGHPHGAFLAASSGGHPRFRRSPELGGIPAGPLRPVLACFPGLRGLCRQGRGISPPCLAAQSPSRGAGSRLRPALRYPDQDRCFRHGGALPSSFSGGSRLGKRAGYPGRHHHGAGRGEGSLLHGSEAYPRLFLHVPDRLHSHRAGLFGAAGRGKRPGGPGRLPAHGEPQPDQAGSFSLRGRGVYEHPFPGPEPDPGLRPEKAPAAFLLSPGISGHHRHASSQWLPVQVPDSRSHSGVCLGGPLRRPVVFPVREALSLLRRSDRGLHDEAVSVPVLVQKPGSCPAGPVERHGFLSFPGFRRGAGSRRRPPSPARHASGQDRRPPGGAGHALFPGSRPFRAGRLVLPGKPAGGADLPDPWSAGLLGHPSLSGPGRGLSEPLAGLAGSGGQPVPPPGHPLASRRRPVPGPGL